MFSNLATLTKIVLAAVISLIVSLVLTPPVRKLAIGIGALDVPDHKRHIHKEATPRMGGLAIYLGFVLSLILFVELTKEVRGILLGSVVIVAMGILDDKYNLRPLIKLAIQILAAGIAILHGVVWDYISSGGGTVSTGLLAYPLTIFWIVACTNAVNLIDGLDGLAAGISSISSLTMLLVAYFLLEPEVAVILAAVFGACIGFLPYNINPAKIFMGDTGSQFLGYLLATASMLGLFKFYAIFTIFVPLVSLVYPLMDTGFAFLRRISHGESPFHADRKHLHHRLLDAGFSPKQAVGILCSGSAFLCLMPIIRVSPFMWLKILCLAGMFATLYIIIMIFISRNGAAK